MAYRRRQSGLRPSTFEDLHPPVGANAEKDEGEEPNNSPASSSLAARAIRASRRCSSFSVSSSVNSANWDPDRLRSSSSINYRGSDVHEYNSMKNSDESKHGFWGILARKAKEILQEDNTSQPVESDHGTNQTQMDDKYAGSQFLQCYESFERYREPEGPFIQKSSDAIASSLNHIGGKFRNALEEGLTMMENRTADIIHETRKLHLRRQGSRDLDGQHSQADQEAQLKASRDLANSMAAKAKLLLRELKVVKADLAFTKERCTQLEEENKGLRENRVKRENPEDDDLIRVQLETLLAEKARIAHENAIYARENRFLREIVEYHQPAMQDIVYLDEEIDEEVFSSRTPSRTPTPSSSPARLQSPSVGIPATPSTPPTPSSTAPSPTTPPRQPSSSVTFNIPAATPPPNHANHACEAKMQ